MMSQSRSRCAVSSTDFSGTARARANETSLASLKPYSVHFLFLEESSRLPDSPRKDQKTHSHGWPSQNTTNALLQHRDSPNAIHASPILCYAFTQSSLVYANLFPTRLSVRAFSPRASACDAPLSFPVPSFFKTGVEGLPKDSRLAHHHLPRRSFLL